MGLFSNSHSITCNVSICFYVKVKVWYLTFYAKDAIAYLNYINQQYNMMHYSSYLFNATLNNINQFYVTKKTFTLLTSRQLS